MSNTTKKQPMSVVKKMMIALVGGLVVGIAFLLLREQLISSGNEGAWTILNKILFQDITAEDGVSAIGLFYIMIAKTWLKTAKIKDVGAYFAVSDAKRELCPWDSHLQVSSRGYMLGYSDLKDPSVSVFFRFLARVGDNGMKMQIVKIGFGGRA